MAGYSSTPLDKKLGLKEDMRAIFLNEPDGLRKLIGPVLTTLHVAQSLNGEADYIHLFTSSRSELERHVPAMIKHISDSGMIWISWPKQSAKVPTDITEQTLRDVILPTGFVDIKVVAIDEVWSGLKFVKRKQ